MRLRSTAKEETEVELEVGLLGGLGEKLLRPSGRTPSIFPHTKKAGRREKESREEGEKKMKPKCEEEALLCLGREQSVLCISPCRKRLKIRGSLSPSIGEGEKKLEMETAAAASCGKTERVCELGAIFLHPPLFFLSFLAACLLMQCKIDAAREKEGRGKKIVQKKDTGQFLP